MTNQEKPKLSLEQLKTQMESDQTNLHNLLNEWYDKALAANHEHEVEVALEEEYHRKMELAQDEADASFGAFIEALGYYDRAG